jgi:hypothetical protein
MYLLSFDVGTKNLAYCKLNKEDHAIREWNVCAVPYGGTNIPKLVQFLKETFDTADLTTVLVEKQPARNPKMRVIENVLLTFFATVGVPTVVSYSAKHKLGNTGRTMRGKANYTMRKKMSVLMIKTYLKKVDSSYVEYFLKSKKQDDLADCLLQYLSSIKYDTDSLTTGMIEI